MHTQNISYDVYPDKEFPSDWHVEIIENDSGDIFHAVFSGPDAEARAREYANWQESKPQNAEQHRAA